MHQRLIWEAFAKRGMGAAASSFHSHSNSVTEDFTIPAEFTEPGISFEDWRAVAFPPEAPAEDTEPNADPDDDDLTNALECYLGSDPVASTASPIEIEHQGNAVFVRYSRRRNLEALGFVEWSTDLENWSRHGVTRAVTAVHGETEQLEAIVRAPANGRLFVRLVVP